MDVKISDYYNRVNSLLLECIPSSRSCIVEIGCGTGALGNEYIKNNPGCHYIGVEVNSAAAEYAETKLNRVIAGNIEQLDLSALIQQEVDCFIYGDVLEHLIDPWRLIKEHASLLKSNGHMIACIPNVQNWQILVNLLHGQWQYEGEGILDETHLRFFTLDTIGKMFSDCGMRIEAVRTTTKKWGNDFVFFKSIIEPVIVKMGIKPDVFFKQVSALQYVVTAIKKP